ncbi:MAG: arginine--tRNA ligase [Acidobacteria bacterium]|nr:arginine--tRNA ligase [Acidobacteriota bacterium]
MIRVRLAGSIRRAIEQAQAAGDLPPVDVGEIPLERPSRKEHGDWSSGVALAMAKAARMKPREVAERIVAELGAPEHVARIEIAGPGFINFFLTHAWLANLVAGVEAAGDAWGRSEAPEPQRIQVEFVSANPTGPMHVGNARWASVGDAIAALLGATGHEVEREYYVNDHGRQVELFGRSLAARYLQRFGREAEMPEGGYQGHYVQALAEDLAAEAGDRLLDAPAAEREAFFREEGLRRTVADIRATLDAFGVRYDVWFSERSLHESGAVTAAVDRLREAGHVYEHEGAVWLRTTELGDDKDRVVLRSNGAPTYLAADVAYWIDKRGRGFDRVIYLWGSDHHGDVPRVRAAIQLLGDDPDAAEFIIGQFVHLTRGGETVRMSKRTGEAVTFDELLEEVGRDAARYHFLRQGIDSTMDFDLDLVVRQSQENPVYYVQYAHARICSILRYAEEQGVALRPVSEVALEELQHESELDLLRKIAELPEVVEVAARQRAPHRLTRYAEDLAALFHAFYRDCRVVSEDESLTQARLHLCRAARISLRNVLVLLGVSAPERM